MPWPTYGGETPAIEQAWSYIRDHSNDDLSLAAVAQMVNMSATYFSPEFKEMAGLTADHVVRTRVAKARNLLLDPNRRVSEFAFVVGFQFM